MKITLITVGKIKEKYLVQGIQEYSKRLQKYTKLEFIEIKDEQAPESLSPKELELIIQKEGQKIISALKPDTYIISLSITGQSFTSEEFAKKIEQIKTYNSSHITFIIGGSNGLSDEVLKQSNLQLSFSSFTYPHQLMKLILIEQIYRSFRINNNEPYHK